MQMTVFMEHTIIGHTWDFLRHLYTTTGASGDINFLTKVLKFSPKEQRVLFQHIFIFQWGKRLSNFSSSSMYPKIFALIFWFVFCIFFFLGFFWFCLKNLSVFPTTQITDGCEQTFPLQRNNEITSNLG